MPRKASLASDTELAILEVLWQRGPCGVREIAMAIYANHSFSLHASASTLLRRLGMKGIVQREPSGPVRRFSARIDRDTYIWQELKRLSDRHFEGRTVPLLKILVDRMATADRKKSHEIIARSTAGSGGKATKDRVNDHQKDSIVLDRPKC